MLQAAGSTSASETRDIFCALSLPHTGLGLVLVLVLVLGLGLGQLSLSLPVLPALVVAGGRCHWVFRAQSPPPRSSRPGQA